MLFEIEAFNDVEEFDFHITSSGVITLGDTRIEGTEAELRQFAQRFPTLVQKAARLRQRYIEQASIDIFAMEELYVRVTCQGDVSRIMQAINDFNGDLGYDVVTIPSFVELSAATKTFIREYFMVQFRYEKVLPGKAVKIMLSLSEPLTLGNNGLLLIQQICQHLPSENVFLHSSDGRFFYDHITEILDLALKSSR